MVHLCYDSLQPSLFSIFNKFYCKLWLDLCVAAKNKLKVPEHETVTVVFEADGTEVDEDDYFQFLPFNTTLMLLRQGENWKSESDGTLLNMQVFFFYVSFIL